MRKNKKLVKALAAALTITTVVSGTEAYARSSKRAAWNDASSTKTTASTVTDACYVEDGSETEEHSVYPNVYADSVTWNEFQKNWGAVKTNYTQAAISPGATETEINFAWYSTREETPMVKWMDAKGKTIQVVDGIQDTKKAETVTDGEKETVLYPNKVTVTGLTENTTYTYKYLVNGKWSETYEYSTEAFNHFSAIYVGDPQIGASVGQDSNNAEYHAMNDAYNWQNTLSNAVSNNPNVSFILSAGDQINQTSVGTDSQKLQQQMEYAGFLSAKELRSIPLATTIGNHDSKSQNYQNHFNNANAADTEETTTGRTAAGTDYYFRHGNTLFVVIDTNNYNCTTHENVIKKAVAENTDATWKVLMFHQDIYGSGYDHSDSDGMILRTTLTPIIDSYGFDAVLQGHDHTYSRTYQISADAGNYQGYTTGNYLENGVPSTQYLKDNASCYDLMTKKEDANKVIDPEGAVYFEANSATGSKYYQLIGTQQDYIAARSQSYRPTYSVLDITDVSLTVKTYDAATGEELIADGNTKTAYTIVKSVDKSSLSAKIKEAEELLKKAESSKEYTKSSLDALSKVIAEAKKVEADKEAATVDSASAAVSLQEAMDGVTKKQAQNISGNSSYEVSYKKNGKFTLNASSNAKESKLTYRSSNTKVASVDANGVVTLKGSGEATLYVTASATDEKKETVKKIAVKILPEKVTKVKAARRSETTVSLSWKAQNDASGYKIYQYNKAKKTYKLVKTIKTNRTSDIIIRNLKEATEYTYAVKAYKTSGKHVLESKSYSALATVATKPGKVTKVKVVGKERSLQITYKNAASVTGYEVQYSTKAGFQKTATKQVTVTNAKTNRITINKLSKKKTYYVRVRAYKTVNGKKVYGDYSKTVKTRTK